MPEKENPISLYFHIPFCTAKCGYCDFNSYELQNLIERKQVHDKNWASEYTDALIIEIEGRVEELQLAGRKVQSVFFGGGTPSLFPSKEIKRILLASRKLFDFIPQAEISLEANPNSSDYDLFKGLKEIGINRISFGVQSFNSRLLKNLDTYIYH